MTISLILDGLIVLIAFLTIFFAARRGFVRTIQSTVIFILSVILTLVLRQPATTLLKKTSLPQKMETSIVSVVSGLLDADIKDGAEPETPREQPTFLQAALPALGISEEVYGELLQDRISGASVNLQALLEKVIVPKTVDVLTQAIAVIGLFIIINLLLRLVFWLLRGLIESIGFLQSVNRVLGVILGIVLAAFRILLFVAVIGALLRVSAISELPVVSSFHIEETYLFRWIDSINPLNAFFS